MAGCEAHPPSTVWEILPARQKEKSARPSEPDPGNTGVGKMTKLFYPPIIVKPPTGANVIIL